MSRANVFDVKSFMCVCENPLFLAMSGLTLSQPVCTVNYIRVHSSTVRIRNCTKDHIQESPPLPTQTTNDDVVFFAA